MNWRGGLLMAGLVLASGAARAEDNPLLAPWTDPEGSPPFTRVAPEHFYPAFTAATEAHTAAIAAITAQSAAPDFENTIAAMERADDLLERVQAVFGVLTSAHVNDALKAVQRDWAPKLAAHQAAIFLDPALFARVKAVHDGRMEAGLSPEQIRVVERMHLRFVRAGAMLEGEARARFAAITERLAALSTQFGQNVLADEAEWRLVLNGEADLAGLPDFLRDAAAAAATEAGLPGQHVITLARSSVETFLTFSDRRDLREQAWRAWVARGDNDDAQDNKAILAEIVALRHERARLLGYPHHAAFVLDDRMARTPEAALALMEQVWAPARARALEEAADQQAIIAAEGQNFALAPWDWRHYAEKLRKARFDIDEAETKPYLQLDQMLAAQFHVANRLFGLTFTERFDVPVWHPDVRVWTVTDAQGGHVGLFYGDFFSRSSKRSGAWAMAIRRQSRFDGEVRPLIINVCNYAKPPEGQPALLSLDDAETLFHEFGHALHGLLSNVTYPSVAGTAVPTDFVEFPAQVMEHWLTVPEVLAQFARHAETGAPMPAELIAKIGAARTFGQGFATVEFLASAFVDMAFHMRDPADAADVRAFQARVLADLDMPAEIVMRHASTHFTHIFSGGYSAGYYSYLWSEVLDTDAFAAFREAGDPFDPATAERLKTFVFAAGNTREAADAYRLFRGRDPRVEALLIHRGFAPAASGN